MTKTKSNEAILRAVSSSASEKVKVAVTDIDGILRGKYINKQKFVSSLTSGFGFCGVIFGWDCQDACYDNSKIAGWHNGYPDVTANIDLSTYREIPWDDDTPFFLADFEIDVCPRHVLKKIIAKADSLGYSAYFGAEFEWFNFHEDSHSLAEKNFTNPEPITPGMFGYSILRQSQNQPFFAALMDEMGLFNIPIEGLHTETGPGVLEAAILYGDTLEAADRAVLFKSSAKEIGQRFGIMPSFMAKWNEKLPGCSGHLHQSLWNKGKTKNLFDDEKSEHRMSALFRQYVAGQLQLLPELLVLFAPTINSYKRLVEGFWAPTSATWGVDNRTTALRVIVGGAKSTRLETRVPGSDINPYLAIAAALGAGLYGIENSLELKQSRVVGNAYEDKSAKKFPRNLYEATCAFHGSKAARSIFGDAFVDHFAASRFWEWRQFQNTVTSYERQRYFEII